ncbi:MAG: hypothetical protein ACP5NF_11550 [Thermoanaerobaculum sp.]
MTSTSPTTDVSAKPSEIGLTSPQKHLLLVNLGKGSPNLPPPGYGRTTYHMPDGKAYSTCIAGLALWRWLVETARAPASVLFACTEASWHDKRESVRREALQLNLPFDSAVAHINLEVPREIKDIWNFLPELRTWLQQNTASFEHPPVLHMDLTHAFRAIPLAHTWLALYLVRRGAVRRGVWGYGAYVPEKPEDTPYLDLSHLMALAEWAEAVSAFRERLDPEPLAALLEPWERQARGSRAGQGAAPPREVRALISAAKKAGPYLRTGFPLEVGLAIGEDLSSVSTSALQKAAQSLGLPVEDLLEELHQRLQEFAVQDPAKRDAKNNVRLDKGEIQRQLHLVKAWLAAGRLDAAVRAFRELIVSRVQLARGVSAGKWLQSRDEAESLLNKLAEDLRPRQLSKEEEKLRNLWRRLRTWRNAFAHSGMRPEHMDLINALKALKEDLVPLFEELNACEGVWRLENIEFTNGLHGTSNKRTRPESNSILSSRRRR